ncbi:uncharacterized protein FIBRA_03887 [Fibroporia radiculosa]|uniref:Uncharacterized protein n=1 Tax=Fibroporia radiculosa TaxID=599839 RepID=J4H2N2_9APHY|nr:uncharacterized protein FIBRA_03887 [Fibroporia radiculosa]CCM01819.1 predicted protein [Fibroporia radiculosa]
MPSDLQSEETSAVEGAYISARTRDSDTALASMARRASRYEHDIKELEAKLAVDMSNSRAIHNLLQEVLSEIQQNQRRADLALTTSVPHVEHSLDENLSMLEDLERTLPRVGQQVQDIRHVYDRGKAKARDLIATLEWLNTPVSLRLRAIIFTTNAPVSSEWKMLIRALFTLALLACIWIAWITLQGAVRAHRQRLVWGERLMS